MYLPTQSVCPDWNKQSEMVRHKTLSVRRDELSLVALYFDRRIGKKLSSSSVIVVVLFDRYLYIIEETFSIVYFWYEKMFRGKCRGRLDISETVGQEIGVVPQSGIYTSYRKEAGGQHAGDSASSAFCVIGGRSLLKAIDLSPCHCVSFLCVSPARPLNL